MWRLSILFLSIALCKFLEPLDARILDELFIRGHQYAAQNCEESKFFLRGWAGVSVVLYTDFPCNKTSHPYYLFCEGSGWGNEEASVACRERWYEYGPGVHGVGGERIDHHHIFEIHSVSYS